MATVFGTVGNDLLRGTLEADWFNGLQGNDQLNLSTDGNFGTDGNDTAYGGYGFDNIFGGNGDDFLVGGAPGADGLDDGSSQDGSDFIDGGGGNDNILGGFGQDTLAGDVGNDTLYGQGDNDTVNGGTGNDFLFGGDSTSLGGVSNASGNDSINGGDGDDNLYGEDGNDTLNAGNGLDVIYAGQGDDEVSGGEGNDFIIGGGWTPEGGIAGAGETSSGRDTLNGGNGNDYIWAGDENDVLTGDSGNDTLYGGAGADFMSGGDGNDVFYVDNAADIVDDRPGVEGGVDAVIVLPTYQNNTPDPVIGLLDTYNLNLLGPEAQIESIILDGTPNFNAVGNGFNNAIQGNAGSNFLAGLDGRDVLNGLGGNDTLIGGDGDDNMIGGDGSDLIGGRDLGGGIFGVPLLGFLTENGNDTAEGGAGDDTLIGGAGNDNMTGGDGNDNIGAVVIGFVGGVPNAAPEAGNDTFDGGAGDDSISGGQDSDSLIGGGGNDFISDGSYTLNPLNGQFQFTGVQSDLDTLVGGVGNDIYFIDRFNQVTGVQDTIIELADQGTDTVFYSGNDPAELTYVLGDNLENLTLGENGAQLNGIGNDLANVITGNGQNNCITGGGGADTLSGGPATAADVDTFVYTNLADSLLANFDRITRFNVAADRIDVSAAVVAVGFVPLPAANNNATSLDAGAIGAVLTNVTFGVNAVTAFTVANTRTFIAINNTIAGYDSTADAIIEITGFVGGNPLVGITLV